MTSLIWSDTTSGGSLQYWSAIILHNDITMNTLHIYRDKWLLLFNTNSPSLPEKQSQPVFQCCMCLNEARLLKISGSTVFLLGLIHYLCFLQSSHLHLTALSGENSASGGPSTRISRRSESVSSLVVFASVKARIPVSIICVSDYSRRSFGFSSNLLRSERASSVHNFRTGGD